MKRIISLILVLMMIFSVCACGKQESAQVQTEAAVTVAETSAETESVSQR
jgi:predicted small lipoprotein YifL